MSEAKRKSRTQGGPKRRRCAPETKRRILETALRVFGEHSFESATLRDVAAEAGVNHGMIRYYYESKDLLWRAAVELLFTRIDEEIDYTPEFLEGLSTVEGFKEWVRRYVRYCARRPEHARIMMQESIHGGERLKWASERFIKPKVRMLVPHIGALIRSGDLPDVPPMTLLYIITAAARAPYMAEAEMAMVFGTDVRAPEAVEAHADAVAAMLFHGHCKDDALKPEAGEPRRRLRAVPE